MTKLPLILFLLAAIIPVFFGKIRSAPLWLGLQGVALAWNSLLHPHELSSHAVTVAIEALALRVLLVPLFVRDAIRRRAEANIDLMPSNLFAWAIAITLVVLAFEFGGAAVSDSNSMTLGIVGATVAIALLLLSSNDAPVAQLVAILLVENALALFESLMPEGWPLPIHGTLSAVYLLTVVVGTWLIGVRVLPIENESIERHSEELL